MGQATVDLPDPMQSPAAPATAGTDDLLAQLAGDEIERLLAETETERPAAPASGAAPLAEVPAARSAPGEPAARESAAPAPLPQSSAASSSEPLPIPEQRYAAAKPPDSSAPVPTSDNKENLTSQLDALFESLNGASSPPVPAAAPLVPVEAANKKTGVTPRPSSPKSDPGFASAAPLDTASSAAELKALGEPIAPADSAAAIDDSALAEPIGGALSEEEITRPSLLVRFLEIINSPLGHCSDPVRQAVGKVAIATLLNAIAVLAYTLVFRHR